MSAPLPASLLDRIAPLHLVFDADGRVTRAGPTLDRIAPGATGRRLCEVVSLQHPAIPADPAALRDQAERRLTLCLAAEAEGGPGRDPTLLRAVVHALEDGGGLMLLAFGADVARGVARHGLGAADLAELDPTIELLFLLELQGTVIDQHGRYAARLAEAGVAAERDASTDALTGLANRRAIDRRLSEIAEGGPAIYGLMQLDLDHFKAVNDGLGHAAGDKVLTRVADILREELRSGDLVARVGGDEFLILLEGCDDAALMGSVAERIIARIEQPIPFEGRTCRISASIGGTLASHHARPDPDRLRAEVDRALYASKEMGRARYSMARPGDGNAPVP